jgi:hypothetical protein
MQAVLESIWELDSKTMQYTEHGKFRILDRPSVHTVNWVFRVRIVPLLPAFESPLSGTWAESTIGGQKELSIVFLPKAQSSIGSDSHVVCTRQLMLLQPGARAKTTQLTYVFQLDFGSHTAALEGILPNMHVEAIRRHRASVTSVKQFFQKESFQKKIIWF